MKRDRQRITAGVFGQTSSCRILCRNMDGLKTEGICGLFFLIIRIVIDLISHYTLHQNIRSYYQHVNILYVALCHIKTEHSNCSIIYFHYYIITSVSYTVFSFHSS